MTQFDDRHFGQPQLARGSQTTVAGNDALAPIHQDGVGPAEFDNAGGEFRHLSIGMRAGITRKRDQRLDLPVLDAQGFNHRNAKTRHRGGS